MSWIHNVERIIIADEELDELINLYRPSEDEVAELCSKYDLNKDAIFDYLRKHASYQKTNFFFEPRKLDEKWRKNKNIS